MPMLVEAGLAAAAGICHWVTTRPPYPAASKEDEAKAKEDRTHRDGFTWQMNKARRTLGVLSAFAQAYVLATREPQKSAKTWLSITCAGYIIMLVGASVRVWCYRTLKNYFTFAIAVQPEQKIVKSGPYKYIAHPSYTGTIIDCIGASMSLFGPYNALFAIVPRKKVDYPLLAMISLEGAKKQDLFRAASIITAIASILNIVWFLSRRIPDEEQMMRDNFGEEYEDFLAERGRLLPIILCPWPRSKKAKTE